ncbi:MAG: hypothetical protein QM627_14045 [Luteolibacter sp.]
MTGFRFTARLPESRFISVGFILLLGMLLMSSCDQVEHRYRDRREVELDRVFEKGWLPSILPSSSVGIVTKNDLDVNVSEGSFRFQKQDLPEFLKLLERSSSQDKNGFDAYVFERWTFWIREDKLEIFCRYRMK